MHKAGNMEEYHILKRWPKWENNSYSLNIMIQKSDKIIQNGEDLDRLHFYGSNDLINTIRMISNDKLQEYVEKERKIFESIKPQSDEITINFDLGKAVEVLCGINEDMPIKINDNTQKVKKDVIARLIELMPGGRVISLDHKNR